MIPAAMWECVTGSCVRDPRHHSEGYHATWRNAAAGNSDERGERERERRLRRRQERKLIFINLPLSEERRGGREGGERGESADRCEEEEEAEIRLFFPPPPPLPRTGSGRTRIAVMLLMPAVLRTSIELHTSFLPFSFRGVRHHILLATKAKGLLPRPKQLA